MLFLRHRERLIAAVFSFYRAVPGTIQLERGWLSAGADQMPTKKTTIYSIELERISEALISSGYTSLDGQAKALGLHRNTAWTIIKNKHKVGRLSAKTIERILRNPETPSAVRIAVGQYLARRSLAADSRTKQRLVPSLKILNENKMHMT
jgi:hypothetical protein